MFIPFRYECALHLGNTTLFPDFTIRHPKTGEFFYWEHFGMIDNATYCQNMTSKLQLYTAHGIIPSIQLITTYETKEHPLSAEMVENIIPYIGGEEEKSEQEPLRIWGEIKDGVIEPATSPVITCQCIRVPVLNGHTAAVFVKFRKQPTKEQLIQKLVEFKGVPQELELPSAPKQFIQYLEEDNRPQVQLDVNYENGMGVSVGRIREDSVYDWKFVGLSHNTVRGAAGGAVLCAELLKAQGYITKK